MIPVITLDELVSHPERARDLPPSLVGNLLARVAAVRLSFARTMRSREMLLLIDQSGTPRDSAPCATNNVRVTSELGCALVDQVIYG
jgi:hypothetical protein